VYIAELLKLAQRYVDLATIEPTSQGLLEHQLTGNRFHSEACVDAVTEHLWKLYCAAIANEGHPETV
jgi:hypothetical protein